MAESFQPQAGNSQIGDRVPEGWCGLTIDIWHLPVLIEVGEKQAVDESGFPQTCFPCGQDRPN